ncbi:hypothetical protein MIR68_000411 [Amoeboaphelidium protococcarum]|nr:hypothetical protein MIR68_000411 [Amoeboaphelidium protococcarum]
MIKTLQQTRQIAQTACIKAQFFAIKHPRLPATAQVALDPIQKLQPLPLPQGVEVNVHPIPDGVLPQLCHYGKFDYDTIRDKMPSLKTIRESSPYYRQLAQPTAIVEIKSADGNQAGYVPVQEWMDLHVSQSAGNNSEQSQNTILDIWHGQNASSNASELKDQQNIDGSNRSLILTCVDPTHRQQARLGAFARTKMAQFIRNIAEPLQVKIRLVGVGYRAAVEPISLTVVKSDAKSSSSNRLADIRLFESWIRRQSHLIQSDPLRAYIAAAFPLSKEAKTLSMRRFLNHDVNLYWREVDKSFLNRYQLSDLPQPQKLIMRLGYSHPVEMVIPPTVNVTCTTPTDVVLSGIHGRQLFEFALQMRNWRKPEPYKGKGIFINDETIILKQKKLK